MCYTFKYSLKYYVPEITLKLLELPMEDFPPLPEDNIPDINQRLPGESILEFTQRVRMNALTSFTKNSALDDVKDIAALTSILDGLDRQEINKAKIEIDNSLAAADQEALSLITAVINSVGNINPYETARPMERTVEHEGPVVSGVVLVPGELDSKPKQSNYDTFMKKYKENNPRTADDDDDD